MKRIGLLVVVTLFAAAGCGKESPAAPPAPHPAGAQSGSATPTSAGASAGPSGTPSDAIEFSVDGAGPYQLGMNLAKLRNTPGLDDVKAAEGCPENMAARGRGTWKDVTFSFHNDGTMYLAVNKSASIPTPSGAWLGTTLAQLKTIYVGITGEDLNRAGGKAGFLVSTLSGGGVLFELDPGQRVISMTAGDAAYLRSNFMGGTAFC